MTPEQLAEVVEAQAEYTRATASLTEIPMSPLEYRGLFGEVVTSDCYRIHDVDFTPDVVLDIGANVGTFTRLAHKVFPSAHVVAVEPHPPNVAAWKQLTPATKHITLVHAALGRGAIWRHHNPNNGAHETYVCEGFGRSDRFGSYLQGHADATDIEAVMLVDLIDRYTQPGQTVVLKMDCEGNENAIFYDEPSMEAMAKVDYITAEVHYGERVRTEHGDMLGCVTEGLQRLTKTHVCERQHTMFYARKRKDVS
jgi:FkbM family methyltransferase